MRKRDRLAVIYGFSRPQTSDSVYVFSCVISLIKTLINYCYWQFDWILLYSGNIRINGLADAEPEKVRHVRNYLAQPQPKYEMCIALFLE